MPFPRRSDPRRPLALAVRSTRAIGIVLLLFTVATAAPLLMSRRMFALGAPFMIMQLLGLMMYLAPAVIYLICSMFLQRRQFWAVVLALVIASIQLLLMLLAVIMLFAVSSLNQSPFLLIPIGIFALFILALAQLIYHLARSFEAIKFVPPEEGRGFELLSVGQANAGAKLSSGEAE